MLKFHFDLIIFFLIIYSSGVIAQTTPEFILPDDLHGTVKLNIATISNQNKERLGYDELAIFVKTDEEEYVSNPIQGQYKREDNYLVFKPYFPFESGMTYLLRTKGAHSDTNYSYQSFQIGQKKTVEQAEVLRIYPSSSQLPENLLRFYIYFNTPMKKGQASKQVQLVDAAGNIDQHAFMEFKQELWSADGKRLTILFDPGRIKRGLSTNTQRGPALLAGKRYQLILSDAWEDVYGQKLLAKTTKEIEVVKAYRHSIKIHNWTIKQPKANSDDPLSIHFDRIIDHALIQSMIKIVDPEKKPIPGYWEILEEERSVQFLPKKKWPKGKYQVIMDSRLEDVAGNNLQNLLDHHQTATGNNGQHYQSIEFKL